MQVTTATDGRLRNAAILANVLTLLKEIDAAALSVDGRLDVEFARDRLGRARRACEAGG